MAPGARLVGCESTEYATKAEAVVEVPDADAGTVVEGPEVDQWCTDFDSTELENLVETSFEGNLGLRAAFARARQARAAAEGQKAVLWPWLNTDAGVTQQRTDIGSQFGADLPTGGGAAQEPDFFSTEDSFTTYRGSVAASYEVDLWGKNRSRWNAAQLDADAARAQAEALAITLTSQIADNWLEVAYQRERIALLEAQIETSEKFYDLLVVRLSRGEATALDVTQQQQNLESLRGQLSLAVSAEAIARNALAVLVGKPPQKQLDIERRELPAVEALPSAGVPADLLERRPDLRAAMSRLRAADKRTEAAVAERLPSLQLSLNLSVQATELAELFDQLLYSLGASLSQPIFQGGRLTAQIEQSEAVAEEALYDYAQTLLTALQEVQDALIREQYQRDFVESLQSQLAASQRALRLAGDRYRLGAVDYLRVLDSIQALQRTQQNLLDAKRQQLSTRVGLCRALGGTWTRDLHEPQGVQP
ncbi:MAG: efflux transporter outer membrane subunit [Persicimonas sp.]